MQKNKLLSELSAYNSLKYMQIEHSDDEKSAMECFETLYKAVEEDASGTYEKIVFGTDAYAAIVAIEKLYKSNSNSYIIKNIYYYAEVISCIQTSAQFSNSKYYNQGIIYAGQIDQSYDGPYAEEIVGLAKKYANNKGDSEKNALTMSASEKAKVKAYINERYEYYDSINGGYAGDKYTETIWQEAAKKFGITTDDVDLIWSEH